MGKGQFRRIPELFETNTHPCMSLFRLGTVSAAQTIPPEKIEAEVAIRLSWDYRMMYPVNVRGNYDHTKPPIQGFGYLNVAVVEL